MNTSPEPMSENRTPITASPCVTRGSEEEPQRSRRERLGPVLIVAPLQRPWRGRFWAVVIVAACGGLLGTAAWLAPSNGGYGTHQQLGLPSCGFLSQTGYPCITCGMTTAFADFAHGHWLRSIIDQPMGFMLALATAILGILSLTAIATGRAVWINWYRVNPVRTVWAVVFLFFAAWAFKIVWGRATGVLPAR